MGTFVSIRETARTEIRPDRESPYVGIHAIRVYVRDQDRSVRFFVDQLGFSVAFDARLQTGERWVAVAAPDGSAMLSLATAKPGSREYKLIGRPTGVVFVTENVPAKFDDWRKRGVRFNYPPRLRRVNYARPGAVSESDVPRHRLDKHTAVWGGVFTRFKDVDGNTYELVGFDEVSREIEEQRKATEDRLESERRAVQELEIAKQVQARLFPQTLPPIRSLDYAGVCIQARQVGGDYYDFLDLGKERFGLVIGDIAGKGMAAALLMANLQANLRSQCAIAVDQPQRLMQSVNRLFHANSVESAYATLFFAEYCDQARHVRYVNCGHLPALVLKRDNTVRKLDSTATILGLFTDWDCTIGECRLDAGDVLALYTDGITECFNEAEEEFGQRRLIDALGNYRERSPQSMIASVVEEVQRFGCGEQQDDITLIVAKCR